ncbi:Metallo-dependent phosphatase-like protein [Thelonectria olida]|uniref:Metallo-dependent phosphatase-like protein n=1 Tax=Thelonectria olida TaxID=1576542 RepID=A0A9P8WIR0_9HYPO|nr:Metallo-dependent phosphatase-like protein [Thelonectria olida]
MEPIPTRFLIISDTHALEIPPEPHAHHHADVAIHCGDLTEESKLAEFRTSLELLLSLDAPLKLVIAGNHDFTLDIPIFKKKVKEAWPPLEPELVTREYGHWGEARQLLERAKAKGVIYLEEGTHRFVLENGAALTVYASPFTPSVGDWGFQYHPRYGHDFVLEQDTDVVITHGPPKGIMDLTDSRLRAGCPDMFSAIARNRPKMHCFGHIHEGWGAMLITWKDKPSEQPSHFTSIAKSVVVQNLAGLKKLKFDDKVTAVEKACKLDDYLRDRYYRAIHSSNAEHPLRDGKHTLFVNAAIKGPREGELQPSWLVDIELQPANANTTESAEVVTVGKRKAEDDDDDKSDSSNKFQRLS